MDASQDSLALNLNSDGELQFERVLLHAGVIERLVEGRTRHEHPVIAFMAGGPASGKTRLMTLLGLADDAVVIDVDRIRQELPEYAVWLEERSADAARLTHREASQIAKLAYGIALERGHNVVFDAVGGDDNGEFSAKIGSALSRNARVRVCYATVPVAVALAREGDRFKRTGRRVPADVLRHKHAEVSRGLANVLGLAVDLVEVYETTDEPHLLARGPGGSGLDGLEVFDASGYAEFLEKARS